MTPESITIPIQGLLAEWLKKDNRTDLIDAGSVTIDKVEFEKMAAWARKRHVDFTSEQCQAWAVLALVGRQIGWVRKKKARKYGVEKTLTWAWMAIVLLLLVFQLIK